MHKITQQIIQQIHPNWLPIFNSTVNMVDLLDETILNVIKTGHKLCPDNPNKILKCLSVDPDLAKVVIVGQNVYPQPGISTGL